MIDKIKITISRGSNFPNKDNYLTILIKQISISKTKLSKLAAEQIFRRTTIPMAKGSAAKQTVANRRSHF